MINLQIEAEEKDPNLKFRPNVSKKSTQIAEQKTKKEFGDQAFSIDVTERLLRDVQDRQEKQSDIS